MAGDSSLFRVPPEVDSALIDGCWGTVLKDPAAEVDSKADDEASSGERGRGVISASCSIPDCGVDKVP